MKGTAVLIALLLICELPVAGQLQQNNGSVDSEEKSTVPLFVTFSSTLFELAGTPSSGFQNISFALYGQQNGRTPLWTETQNVRPDKDGNFTILLGSASPLGVPASLFSSGLPRWVGITPNDGVERPRVELASVPYALKAFDADTLGGVGPQEFVTVGQLRSLLGNTRNYPLPPINWMPTTTPQGSQPQY
jgi:hypothetical protein